MSEAADQQLVHLLELSEAMDDDIGKLLRKCRQPVSRRALISTALCHTSFEHAVSQRVLIEAGLTGTGMALCRLHFEAVVRAAWTHQGASDKWLETFATPVPEGAHREPTMGPPIPSMLDAFALHAPDIAAKFRELYGTIAAMHSFVHGGVQAVAHKMRPYPADKLISVLQNRNLLQWFTANCAVMVAQDPGLLPRLRLVREKHVVCMPLTAPMQSGHA